MAQELDDRPLPDPFPDYVTCPVCGEPDIELWCYEESGRCPNCGAEITHGPFPCWENCPRRPLPSPAPSSGTESHGMEEDEKARPPCPCP